MTAAVDDRVKIWARVKLGGERPVDVAWELCDRNQSGITQVLRRLEGAAKNDTELKLKLESLKNQV